MARTLTSRKVRCPRCGRDDTVEQATCPKRDGVLKVGPFRYTGAVRCNLTKYHTHYACTGKSISFAGRFPSLTGGCGHIWVRT